MSRFQTIMMTMLLSVASYSAIDYWQWKYTGILGSISYSLIPESDRQQLDNYSQRKKTVMYQLQEDRIVYRSPILGSVPLFPFYRQLSSEEIPQLLNDARTQFEL